MNKQQYAAYNSLGCEALLEIAPFNKDAANVIANRAASWTTCAVGEAAAMLKVKVDPVEITDLDRNLEDLGVSFSDYCDHALYAASPKEANRYWIRAKNLYQKIQKRVPIVVSRLQKAGQI